MAVYSGSRYENSEFTTIIGRDGVARNFVHPRKPLSAEDVDPNWAIHEVRSGEELDQLAYEYAGQNADKCKLWWLIAEVNGVLWPLDIPPGSEVMIPLRELREGG